MNALILGGSRGVGFAISEQFAQVFQNICIASRSVDNLKSAKKDLSKINPNVYEFAGDVSDVNFARSLSSFLNESNFGDIDILICNAGGPPQKNFLATSDEDWHSVIETSLLGQVRVVREFLPRMVEKKFGRIIFISSTVAKEPSPSMVLSATARAGISAFSKAISGEFAKYNVTANVIYLGGVLTDRLHSLIANASDSQGVHIDEIRSNLVSGIPMGRFAEPKEIANLVSFLASNEAGYITGASIVIDGGITKGIF